VKNKRKREGRVVVWKENRILKEGMKKPDDEPDSMPKLATQFFFPFILQE